MLYNFKLRDGEITISKKMYDLYFNEEWFLSNLINYCSLNEDTEGSNQNQSVITIELYESKNAVMTLLDSLRFNKLVMYDESIDYIISLADYWCAPEWLQTSLLEYKDTNETKIKKLVCDNEKIKHCVICHIGYKESENTGESCQIHSGAYNFNFDKFSCCGRTSDDSPCKKGFHKSCE